MKNKDVNILAVCDVYEDRVARAVSKVLYAGMNVKGFTDYKEALHTQGIDTVLVFADWSPYAELSVRDGGAPLAMPDFINGARFRCFVRMFFL